MRRLLLPFAIAAVLLVAGCGDERPGAVRDAGATFSAAPSTDPTPSTSRPTPTPTPTPASATSPAAPTGPLASFPLDLGYADENGDDHSPVVVTDQPGLHRFDLCGRVVWDPWAGTTDLIGVEFRGEAEWSRGRTLVLYPSVDVAAAEVAKAHDAIANCPEETPDAYGNAAHTLLDVRLGDQSVVWIDRWRNADLGGMFDTGLTVYHLVRVGRAVLASYEYGEGNGSDESRERSVAEATEADRPVVDRMRELPTFDGKAETESDIPADFPLQLGLVIYADTKVAGPGRQVPGAFLETLCGSTTWPGPVGNRTDRLAVQLSMTKPRKAR